MPRGYVNNTGTWQKLSRAFVNINGTWTQIKRGYANILGAWTQIWSSGPGDVTSLYIKSFVNGQVTDFFTTGSNTTYVYNYETRIVSGVISYFPSSTNAYTVSSLTSYVNTRTITAQSSIPYNANVVPFTASGGTQGNAQNSTNSTATTSLGNGADAMTVSFGTPTIDQTTFGNTKVTFSWTISGSPTDYYLDVRKDSSSGTSVGTNNGVTYPGYFSAGTTQTQLTNLTDGVTYYCVVIPRYYPIDVNANYMMTSTAAPTSSYYKTALPPAQPPNAPTITINRFPAGSNTSQDYFAIFAATTGPTTDRLYIEVYRGSTTSGGTGLAGIYMSTAHTLIETNAWAVPNAAGWQPYGVTTDGFYWIKARAYNAISNSYSSYVYSRGTTDATANSSTLGNYFSRGSIQQVTSPSVSATVSSGLYYAGPSWTNDVNGNTVWNNLGIPSNQISTDAYYSPTTTSTQPTAPLDSVTPDSNSYFTNGVLAYTGTIGVNASRLSTGSFNSIGFGSGQAGKYLHWWVRGRNEGYGSSGLLSPAHTQYATPWLYAGYYLMPSAGLTPTLSSATSSSTGYTVTLSGYNSNYTYSCSVNNGSVSPTNPTANGTITVTTTVSTTLTVTTTRSGYFDGSASVTANKVSPPVVTTAPSLTGTAAATTSISANAGTYTGGTVSATGIAYSTIATLYSGIGTSAPSLTHTSPYTVTNSDATATSYTFWAYDKISGNDGNTYYSFSSPVLSGFVPNAPTGLSITSGALATWTKSVADSTHNAATGYKVNYFLASSSSGANAFRPSASPYDVGDANSYQIPYDYNPSTSVYCNYTDSTIIAYNQWGETSGPWYPTISTYV